MATTTSNFLKVEDITFKGSRLQSQIKEDLPEENVADDSVLVPVSVTPESITKYFLQLAVNTTDMNKRRIFSEAVRIIQEYPKVKEELRLMKLDSLRNKDESLKKEEITDIQED